METEPVKSHGAGKWAVWTAAALVFYVLSFGPVAVVVDMRVPHSTKLPTFNFVYRPLLLWGRNTMVGFRFSLSSYRWASRLIKGTATDPSPYGALQALYD